jgi:hypothetical protein
MKRIIFLLVITLLLSGCNKDNSGTDDSATGKVTIKGTISASGTKRGTGTKAGGSLSLADAKKVMLFRGSSYSISDIVNNSFSVSADAGSANALVFLDKDNKFIGVLCTEGLNVLPLVGLNNGDKTIIDLQTLTMPGDSIVPLHNPFGDEINISPAELESLRAVGSYYESLAKNIDADGDGELDILSNKQISLTFHFNLYIGKMGLDNVPPDAVNEQNLYINYGIELAGGTNLGTVSDGSVLTGPEGDPSTDIKLWGFANTVNSRQAFLISFIRQGLVQPGNPMGNNFLPFKKGIYTFTPYQGTSMKLHFSNVDARANLIIVSPTLNTDGNGKIVSVSFKYAFPNGTEVNPENLISDFMLQFINTDNQQFLVVRPVADHGYYKYTFPSPVDLERLKGMDLFYYDLLGNYYNNNWKK